MSKPVKTMVRFYPSQDQYGSRSREWEIKKASLEYDDPWIRFKTSTGRDVALVLSSRDTLIVEDQTDVEKLRQARKSS